MATSKIADWVEHLTPDSLPAPVNEAAVKSFANYVGCAIGGINHEATQLLVKTYSNLPQVPGQCSVLGNSNKVDPLQAALINGFTSHLHDYDDTHLATVIHPTTCVASALLAYTDLAASRGQPLSGSDFICALVAGIEVQCLLGLAVYPSHYTTGWHITATVGSIGAAIAVAKAMRLPREKLVNAVGIASAQVLGMRRHFGSHTKPLGAALAAQSGLQSAFLAQGGMTAATDSIEGPRGWIECVCPEKEVAKKKLDGFLEGLQSGKAVDGDGKREMEKNTFKPFPCGIVIHPVIDGCAQLREEGVKAEDVEAVELQVHPLVLELTGKKLPKDGLEAKFSVYHGAACGLLFGKASPSEYTDEVVKQTADLRSKINAAVDKGLKADECHITIRGANGAAKKHVEHAVGSLDKPMSPEQFRKKFLDQAGRVLGQSEASELFDSLLSIMKAPDLSSMLRGGG